MQIRTPTTSQEQWADREEEVKATLARLIKEGKPAINAVMALLPMR